MKIVYFTDSHISHKVFSSRKDNYVESIKRKLMEVVAVANKINADYIVCGGDLFHSPTPTPNSVMVANDIATIFHSANADVYVVPGNHDEFGYNTATLNKTLLGIYAANNTVKILDRDNPITHKVGDKLIAIEGQEYYEGIDNGDDSNFTCKVKADYNLLVIHAMLAKAKVLSHYKKNNVKCIDVDNVNTNANMVLAGHEHHGFRLFEINDTIFINPSSLARTSRDLTHHPSCVVIRIEEDLKPFIKTYALQTALKSEDIFDNEIHQKEKESKNVLATFEKQVKNITSDKTDIDLKNVIDNEIKALYEENNETLDKDQYKDLVDIISKYIQLSDEEQKICSHIPKNYLLRIKEIEIKNFQSHKDTTISFDELMTIIAGESDSGKKDKFVAVLEYNRRKF